MAQSRQIESDLRCIAKKRVDLPPDGRRVGGKRVKIMPQNMAGNDRQMADPDFSVAEQRLVVQAGREVIQQEAQALALLAESLEGAFAKAVSLLLGTQGRVIVTGIGKSGHVGGKIAATLSATGTSAHFVHPAEAAHGDLGMIASGDTLLVLSNSGATQELRAVVSHAKRLSLRIVAIVARTTAPLARQADVVLALPDVSEACPARIAPTTSTTMMMALGDALALALMQRRGITRRDLLQWHPGGAIGYRLLPVDHLLQDGRALPLVSRDAPMRNVVLEMTAAGKGVAGVVDDAGHLAGVITDGDLRRAFDQILVARASDIMTQTPITIASGTTIEDALLLMNEAKITVVFVMDAADPRRPVGIVHIHDLAMGL